MWRLHYSVRLPSLGCDFFKLTGTEGSGAGDYVLADRGYSNAAGIRHVATAGGHVTVRVNSGALPLETAYRGDPPVDMMDKPLRALPTSPPAQQQRQEDLSKEILAV